MNETKQVKFKEDFKEVIDARYKLQKHNKHLSRLFRWDKNDSHKDAITKALDKKDELDVKLAVLLVGYTYDQWAKTANTLSQLKRRFKTAKTIETKDKIELLIKNLKHEKV